MLRKERPSEGCSRDVGGPGAAGQARASVLRCRTSGLCHLNSSSRAGFTFSLYFDEGIDGAFAFPCFSSSLERIFFFKTSTFPLYLVEPTQWGLGGKS